MTVDEYLERCGPLVVRVMGTAEGERWTWRQGGLELPSQLAWLGAEAVLRQLQEADAAGQASSVAQPVPFAGEELELVITSVRQKR
jgi:hypothetical protein